MKDENFTPTQMTAEEKAALMNFQERINTNTGELEPEKTHIQKANIMEVMYNADLPNEDYHNSNTKKFAGVPYREILSAGKLKACITPLHYLRNVQNPPANSKNLNNGSAFHEMILEPEKFEWELYDDTKICDQIMASRPDTKNVKATKEYREWKQKYLDADGNLRDNVLEKNTFQTMWQLKKKLAADEVLKSLFRDANMEQSIFVYFDGLRVKVRPDGLKIASANDARNLEQFGVKKGDLIIISVKTTIDASPSGFLRQCIRLGYNITEAFYFDVIERTARHIELIKPGNNVKTIFLTLEKEKETFTGHYLLRPATDDFIQWGRYDYARNLDVYMNTKDFTEGYEALNGGSTVLEISAPARYGTA